MMYAVERVNIYLEEEKLGALRALSEQRDEPVAALVREAVDDWLRSQNVRALSPDEWERRFDALLKRRDRIAEELDVTEAEVEQDVMAAVKEVRRNRAARRR